MVGTGIALGQASLQTISHIEQADKVLYLVGDPATQEWIHDLNPTAENLHHHYALGKERLLSYNEMVEDIMSYVREGLQVCVVFYGHPGVFVHPSHEAIRLATREGFSAFMLPAISAEDCLFADLGVDPSTHGCQSYEATSFLIYKRRFDPRSALILWQVGVIGNLAYGFHGSDTGLATLTEYLLESYDPAHEVTLYEAAQYPVCSPVITRCPLHDLPMAPVHPHTTLYVPPREQAPVDWEMIQRLRMGDEWRARRRANLPDNQA